jgi:hypothetical protein
MCPAQSEPSDLLSEPQVASVTEIDSAREARVLEQIKEVLRSTRRDLTRDEALELVARPMLLSPLVDRTPQLRRRGRPRTKPPWLKDAEDRRRQVFVRLKSRPENARLQGNTTARAAHVRRGEPKRRFVRELVDRGLRTGHLPSAGDIAAASQAPGNPAMSHWRARELLRELGY